MTEHELKTAPEHFEDVRRGLKTAELRKNDRNFAVGDVLVLREWDRTELESRYMAWWDGATYEERHFWYSRRLEIINSLYTGRTLRRRVTHVLRGGPWLCEGFVMLSLGRTARQQLDNLADAMVKDIMEMSDAEVIEEFLEDGGDLEKLSREMHAITEKAIAKSKETHP